MKFRIVVSVFLGVFLIAGCDSGGSLEQGRGEVSSASPATDTMVYFPSGGGFDFDRLPLKGDRGEGWEYKDYVVAKDWGSLKRDIRNDMVSQGYGSFEGNIDLQGFESAIYFVKAGSLKRVSFRAKPLQSGKVLVRLSWSL